MDGGVTAGGPIFAAYVNSTGVLDFSTGFTDLTDQLL